MKAVMILVICLSLVGCLTKEVADQNLFLAKQNIEDSWEQVFCKSFSFWIPAGWNYSFDEAGVKEEEELSADYIFRVKNIEEEIQLGAVNLGEERSNRNSNPNFELFYVSIYVQEGQRRHLSWSAFFEKYYPEIITFQAVENASEVNSNMVVATKVDGLLMGKKRVFVRQENVFYDFSWHTSSVNNQEAEQLFWTFVQKFSR